MAGGDQDWQVGDLALCVSTEGFRAEFLSGQRMSTKGSVSQVKRVTFDRPRLRRRWFKPNAFNPGGIWLVLDNFENVKVHSSNFRKIRPHAPDAEDAETIALLNGQPARPAQPDLAPAPARTPEPVA